MKNGIISLDTSPLPPMGGRLPTQAELDAQDEIDSLAAHIRNVWETNTAHKRVSGIEEVMLQCTRQRNGEYDADDLKKIPCDFQFYLNVTGLKCRAAEAWLKDVLVNAADEPWTISPSGDPELPEDLLGQVADLVKREVLARGYVDTELIKSRIKELKDTARQAILQLAQEACDRMTVKINDQMTTAHWKEHFEKWQSDIITYPSGILKGPLIHKRKVLKWRKNKLEYDTEIGFAFERVAPPDLYPSAEATTPNNAISIIERMRLTKSQLFDCIGQPHFSEDAIRLVLQTYEEGFRDWLSDDGEREISEKKLGSLWGTDETIDVLDFWGRVQGNILKEWGIDVDDEEKQYEINAWLVGDYVIRSLLNPDPLGRRPYNVTSFNKLPGQFWGEGIPQLIRDIQRMANSAARALIRNMAFSAGPIVELDVTRLDEGEARPDNIEPYRVYYTTPATNDAGPALRFEEIPSVASEMQAILQQYLALADDFSGVPSYSYGNTEAAQGAGQTMGGLSLLYGNALKGIKNVIMNMDRDGIEPIIRQIWTYNMLYDPDPSIKADAKIVANGAEGILQKEQTQARSIETLQVITPWVQQGLLPQQAAQYVLQQWLQQTGWDVSRFFPNSDVNQEISQVLGNPTQTVGAPAQVQPSAQPGTPTPPLDGRQAPVQQVMQQSQIPPNQ